MPAAKFPYFPPSVSLRVYFLYINYINQYTLRDTVDDKYGNLAADINSAKKSSISSYFDIL